MLPSSEVAGSGEVGGGISPRWLHCQAFHPISGRVRNAPKNVTRPPGPLPLPPPNLHVTGPKNQNPMRQAVKGPARGGGRKGVVQQTTRKISPQWAPVRFRIWAQVTGYLTRSSALAFSLRNDRNSRSVSKCGFPLGKRHISLPIPRRDSHKTLASALSRARGARRRSETSLIVRV